MPPRKSPSKKNDELQKIRDEVAELREHKKKTRRLISEMGSFQNSVGRSVIPLQKFFLYVFLAVIFGVGIYIVVEGDTGKNPEGVSKSAYIGVGIVLMVLAVIILVGSYFWFKAVENNRSMAQLNALAFEAGFAKDLFRG